MNEASPQDGECPVLSYSPHERRPIGEWAAFFDQLRADAPVVRNTFADGYYVLTRYKDILAACNAQALYSDLDHTVPYPDGPTDQCNLTPKCRRHHRTKQAPGWTVTQPTPGTTTWTTPSGRTHTTKATAYDV